MYMKGGTKEKLRVKNKSAAPVQITAEQLLREAIDRQFDDVRPPSHRIVDEEELQNYRVRKRKEYEDILRRQRHHMGTWIKYATWEADQHEFRRARSVFERALQVDYQNVTLWQKYIEMETLNKFINSARNLYDRVCLLLPRVDKFWMKYAHMEEVLGNYAGARAIYDRWMAWLPDDEAWMLYIRFEERCNQLDLARKVIERYLSNNPSALAFLRSAKFEMRHHNVVRARASFEKAIEILTQDELDERFYIRFARFEAQQHEYERAQAIYQYALNILPGDKSKIVATEFVRFQKQHGNREMLEKTLMEKRRNDYKEKLKTNSRNYDAWLDHIRLEEANNDITLIRQVYEEAIKAVPPVKEKKYWKRYIYIWINYAVFEELKAEDVKRAEEVYTRCLDAIPHQSVRCAKIWVLTANFYLRQENLAAARRIFGRAIAECGKEAIFVAYANLELRLGQLERCRTIYGKFIEHQPLNPQAWITMMDFEVLLKEYPRARALAELAIDMEKMEKPELVWKAYIDFETSLKEFDKVRRLFERLLVRTEHFKVYKSYASFEFDVARSVENARRILRAGIESCSLKGLQDEKAALLEYLLQIEKANGDESRIAQVSKEQPKRVKRRRQIVDDEGNEQGWEEYMAYIFPDDEASSQHLKILEAAKAWTAKRKKTET